MPLQETQTSTDRSCLSPVGSLLLFPGSWCTQNFVCVLQEFVSLVLWKFCNQLLLVFRVWFLGIPSPLGCPQAGESDVGFKLSQQYENLWYYCSPLCGVAHLVGIGIWFYSNCAPPTISLWLLFCPLDVRYLFVGSTAFQVVQKLVAIVVLWQMCTRPSLFLFLVPFFSLLSLVLSTWYHSMHFLSSIQIIHILKI